MLVHPNASSTPTPGTISSNINTLEHAKCYTTSPPLSHHIQSSSSSIHQLQQKQDMGCTRNAYSRPSSRAPSILDSPTLARVERARLRLEASNHEKNINNSCGSIIDKPQSENSVERNILGSSKQFLLAGRVPVSSMTGPIKRGLLFQQRDRIFSRWKERYFVLTRDYLHCFKRASGSTNGRASDMGQFIFKIKLVDVDKVEWLNRRSYSAIGLLLGREGRILLRCDEGLEDWFELLEECTLTSKERRKALRIAQGPRSRASIAVPVSHASLQDNNFGLCDTYSSTFDDWLIRNESLISGVRGRKFVNMCDYGEKNPLLFADSVPDLSTLNNEKVNQISGFSTNHSTPQKVLHSDSNNSNRYIYSNITYNHSSCTGNTSLHGSPQRILINSSSGLTQTVNEESEVELRRPHIFRQLSMENGNVLDRDWLYRKPNAPKDMRHSVQPILSTHNNTSLCKLISDLDYSTYNCRVDTPPSKHRPCSYREQPSYNVSPKNTAEISVSPFRCTIYNSAHGSVCSKPLSNNGAASKPNQVNALHFNEVQEDSFHTQNEEQHSDFNKSKKRVNHNELYDPNQNYFNNNDHKSAKAIAILNSPEKSQYFHYHNYQLQTQFRKTNDNSNDNAPNNNNNGNNRKIPNNSAVFRGRYQHPALVAIMNDSQGIKFRERCFSDCQQSSRNNNPSPSISKRNHINSIFSTPTKV